MSRKSHKNGKGILILFLIALIALLGCPTGSSTDPTDINTPEKPSGGGGGGGGGNGGGDPPPPALKTDSDAATTLAGDLNTGGNNYVTPNGATVTVNPNTHLQVAQGSSSILALSLARAGSVDDPGTIKPFIIPKGVTFSIPASSSVTIISGAIQVNATDDTYAPGTIQAAGSIIVKATEGLKAAGTVTLTGTGSLALSETATVKVNDGGKIDVASTAVVKVPVGTTIAVETGGAIEVKGVVEAAGTIAVAAAATVNVPQGGKVEVTSGGKITVAAGRDSGNVVAGSITVAANATIVVASGAKVENSGTITATGTVDVKAGGTVDVKSGGSLEVNNANSLQVESSGDVKIENGADIVVNANIGSSVADKITVENGANVTGSNDAGKAALALTLVSQTVAYASGDSNKLTITFVFSDTLVDTLPTVMDSNWSLVLSKTTKDKDTITATYNTAVTKGLRSLAFTGVSNADPSKTTAISTSAYAVENTPFTRSGATYQVVYYGEVVNGSTTYAIAGLKNGSTDPKYYIVTDSGNDKFKTLFKAIYTPNAPGPKVPVEAGKTAITYDATISAAALSLFHVTLQASDYTKDKVELKDTTAAYLGPLNAKGSSSTNLVVIDIGVPGTSNTGLPTFYIPVSSSSGELGLADGKGDYGNIRLRVNQGAELVILADNSGYISKGAGNSYSGGKFTNGCVEVMAGGKLRDGAFEGFPLGTGAVILNHAGSYLSVGPEPGSADATSAKQDAYNQFYAGYLIGPDGAPRIVWDSGNTGYLEVRQGKLAISGNVTVKKLLGLIYSAWFVGNTTVTIENGGTLVPNGAQYEFYGTDTQAKIVVKQGGTIGKGFLTGGSGTETDAAVYLTAKSETTIANAGTGGANADYTNIIKGTQNWSWTEDNFTATP
jgi:hypothetical protein